MITESENDQDQDWLEGWTKKEVRQEQRDDPNLGRIIKGLEDSPQRPNKTVIVGVSRDINAFSCPWDVLLVRDGLL